MSTPSSSAARWTLVALLLAASGGVPALAHAQSSSDEAAFAALDRGLRPGDKVTVTLPDGSSVRGHFAQVSPELLSVLTSGGPRELELRDVQRVKRTRMGFTLGAIVGAGAGLAVGAGLHSVFADEGQNPAGTLLAYAGLGTAIGIATDALVNLPRTVYTREARRVSLTPVVTPHAVAAGVRVTF